jgi:hypothetical protein
MKSSQNSTWLKRILVDSRRESLAVSPDGATGVGGRAGMKKEGTAQTEDWERDC